MNISLPNNRFILNGHRIFSIEDLISHINKKFKVFINSYFEIGDILASYPGLKIEIWHSDTFLKDESKETLNNVLNFLGNYGTLKLTGKHK